MQKTLSYFNVDCKESYYVSTGEPLDQFPVFPFRMNFYSINLCLEGFVIIEIDNKQYKLTHHALLVTTPNTSIKFIKHSVDFRMKLLFFERNFILKNIANPFIIEKSSLFKNRTFNIIQISTEKSEEIVKILEYLNNRSNKSGKYISEISRTIIFNILLEIAEIYDENKTKENPPKTIYYKFCEALTLYISQHKEVSFYADLLCVSNKYLIEIIKEASGKTPHQLIDEYLLKEAISFLGDPDKTISEIAFFLNFSSVSSFGRFFKKQTNISPLEYRKLHQIL